MQISPQLNKREHFSWDYFSRLIILGLLVLQTTRLPFFPQGMDIYYHLLAGWGFSEAGGYVGWDFWEYAPVGRPHMYPPFFHSVLGVLMKFGADPILLAKVSEAFIPVIFLVTLWYVSVQIYGQRFAFFTLIFATASLPFFMNLTNHIPSTLAIIFGLLACKNIFASQRLRAVIWFSLAAYTHFAVFWCFFIAVFITIFLAENLQRKRFLTVLLWSFVCALPMILKELTSVYTVSLIGYRLNEKYLSAFRPIEYLLAIGGFWVIRERKTTRNVFFIGLFMGSLLFLSYPYRFFSAEGYLAIVFLAALTLDSWFLSLERQTAGMKIIITAVAILLIQVLPTIQLDSQFDGSKPVARIDLGRSAFTGIALPQQSGYKTLWFPREYLGIAESIKQHTHPLDIVYSDTNIVGLMMAAISGRPSANGLLPEIQQKPVYPFDNAKIIVFTADTPAKTLDQLVSLYGLTKIGENKLFLLYKNPSTKVKAQVRKASVPFWALLVIAGGAGMLYCRPFLKKCLQRSERKLE